MFYIRSARFRFHCGVGLSKRKLCAVRGFGRALLVLRRNFDFFRFEKHVKKYKNVQNPQIFPLFLTPFLKNVQIYIFERSKIHKNNQKLPKPINFPTVFDSFLKKITNLHCQTFATWLGRAGGSKTKSETQKFSITFLAQILGLIFRPYFFAQINIKCLISICRARGGNDSNENLLNTTLICYQKFWVNIICVFSLPKLAQILPKRKKHRNRFGFKRRRGEKPFQNIRNLHILFLSEFWVYIFPLVFFAQISLPKLQKT